MATHPRGRGRGEDSTSPRRIAAGLRDNEAVRLHLAEGLGFDAIAARLGYSQRGDAYRAVWRRIREVQWNERIREFELMVRRRRRAQKQLIAEHPDDELLPAHRERFEAWVKQRRARLHECQREAMDRVGRTPQGCARREEVRRAS